MQPSLVYRPGGTSAALFNTLAAAPLLALPRRGAMLVQPVHLDDVVAGFENQVTWLSLGSQHAVSDTELARLRAADVLLADQPPRAIVCRPGEGIVVEMLDGQTLSCDVIYPALGLVHASELDTALGARAQENGQLEVDDHLQTTVPGLYVAGDVASGLNQINVAAGHAAIAVTAIHNSL